MRPSYSPLVQSALCSQRCRTIGRKCVMQSNSEGDAESGISKELNLALYPLRIQETRRELLGVCVWVSEKERDNLKSRYNHFRILFNSSQKRPFLEVCRSRQRWLRIALKTYVEADQTHGGCAVFSLPYFA